MTDIKLVDLPYQEALVSLYPYFRDLPYPILLDSNHAHFSDTQFDILVADPIATIEAHQDSCTLSWHKTPLYDMSEKDSLFAMIQSLTHAICQEDWALRADKHLPFTGGLVGYVGYDSGHFLETLPRSVIQDVEIPDAVLGLYGWALISCHHLRKTWLMLTPWCDSAYEAALLKRCHHASQTSNTHEPFVLLDPFSSNMSATDYEQKFQRVKQYLVAGDCYQVNLAQRFSAPYRGDCLHAFHQLRQVCPTPFAAFLELPNKRALLSHSPERFLRCDQGQVESKPIKGTRPRGKTVEEDIKLAQELLLSDKDKAENLMIVDLLRNDMGRTCQTGSIHVPKLFALESYANVHHMVSTVTGNVLHNHDHVRVFAGCFPGGSITGAPKIRAMQIIDELEPHTRSAYCGSVVYFSANGQMDSSITIRTLVADGAKIHCWAGGGLVLDSIGTEEYQETFTKVGRLTQALEQNFLN